MAITTNAICNSFKKQLLAGEHDFDSAGGDTFKLAMYTSAAVLGASTTPVHGEYAYQLGGNSCLAGDFMSEYGFQHPVQVGDRVVLKDMMHYTMVKTSFFNGVNHPSIGIWDLNNKFNLARQFSYFDYKSKLS